MARGDRALTRPILRAARAVFDLAVLLFLLAVAIRHFNIVVENFYTLQLYNPEDQATYNNVLWNLSHRLSWEETVLFDTNYLAVHFVPALLFVSPIYRLSPAPQTTWLMLSLGLAGGIFLLYRIAATRLQTRLGGFAFVVLLVAHPALTSNLMVNGFHTTAVAVCFLCSALWAYERRRFPLFLAGFVLSAMCKEDIPFIGIGFSLLALIQQRPWRWAMFPGAFAVLYAALAFAIMQRMGDVGVQQDLAGFEYLGRSTLEVTSTLFLHPSVWIAQVTSAEKLGALRQLFSPFGFLSLLAPEYVLVAGSQFAEVLLGSQGYLADMGYWYVSPVIPFVFYAAVVGLRRIMRLVVYGLEKLVRISGPASHLFTPERLRQLVATAAGVALAVCAWRPLVEQVKALQGWRQWIVVEESNIRRGTVDSLVRQVPTHARVCAQHPYTLMFSTRPYIHILRMSATCDAADYVVVGSHPSHWPATDEEYESLLADLADEQVFRSVYQTEDIQVYSRRSIPPSMRRGPASLSCRTRVWHGTRAHRPGCYLRARPRSPTHRAS